MKRMAIAAAVCVVAMVLGALLMLPNFQSGDPWWNALFGASLGLFVVASFFSDQLVQEKSLRVCMDALWGVLLGLAWYALSRPHTYAITAFILGGLVAGPLLGRFKDHLSF